MTNLNINKKKIIVIGAGYVGMSISSLLAQHNDVIVVDINKERVKKINNKISTVADKEITEFLTNKDLSILATHDYEEAVIDADFVIIATPTNYDIETNFFDTKSVEESIKNVLKVNKSAVIIIKSTVPVGFTEKQISLHKNKKIYFSPEFLREGSALLDNLYPSRIIIGGEKTPILQEYVNILYEAAISNNYKTIFMPPTEAESVKLFSNTYLAMRVAYFNELDSFALSKNLNTEFIINGVSLDERIGDFYNNPSFGYGGYCLPKDTKQLLANFSNIDQNLIGAIVESNETRKSFIADNILKINPSSIGIYGLAMKEGSDNFRDSSIQDVIKKLKVFIDNIVIYEPMLKENTFLGCRVVNEIKEFKSISELILTNRINEDLKDVHHKIFTRDIYNNN